MSPAKQKWKKASKLLLAIGVIAALLGAFPVGKCMFDYANAPESTTLPGTGRSGDSALDLAEEARNRGAPTPSTGYFDRLTAAAPGCYSAHPIQQNSAVWAVAFLALIGAALTRVLASRGKQDDIVKGIDREQRRAESISIESSPSMPGVDEEPQIEAIDLSQELELTGNDAFDDTSDRDSVMAFMQEREQKLAAIESEAQHVSDGSIDGFYCPPGLAGRPVLYVEPDHQNARDAVEDVDSRIGSQEAPFRTIAAALEGAKTIVRQTQSPVQVRVAPGVYQESLELPDRVSLVNHRMPAEGSVKQRLKWVCNQSQLDDEERVTILPSAEDAYAISVAAGRKQGIFGCWIVGRDGVKQSGIVADGSTALAVVHCAMESFREGAIVVKNCGAQQPDDGLNVIGSRLRKNGRSRGGAIYAQKSSLLVRKTMLHDNRARQGAGIFTADMRAPVELVDVGFERNHAKNTEVVDIEQTEPQEYAKSHGHGGGAAFLRSDVRLIDCKFTENRADAAGGAFAGLGSRLSIRTGESDGTAIRANRADVGGAAALVGWAACAATLKFHGTDVRQNIAKSSGGGIVCAGLATVQFKGGSLEKNICESPGGIGGGVAVLVGARFMAKETRFRGNRSRGSGGAIATRNAHVVLADGCIVEENVAQGGDGGGLSCETRPDRIVESLMNLSAFKLPFLCEIRDVSIRNNTSLKSAAGVRAGNHIESPSFPLKVDIQLPERIRLNEVKSPGAEANSQIMLRWAGETRGTARDIDGAVLLK
jgi:predicted outer membrane repeat protein